MLTWLPYLLHLVLSPGQKLTATCFGESLEDDPRFECPATATSRENIACVNHMMMDGRHLTVNEIVNVVSISREHIENNVPHEHGLSKVSSR